MSNGFFPASRFALPEVLVSRQSSRHALSSSATDDRPPGRAGIASRLKAVPHDPLLVVAALASVGAGIIHAAVTPEHTNWWASVAFFVTLALFQLGWGGYVVLRKPTPLVLLLGAAVNLAALATWTVSRISGMPFGPHQGVAEPAARADIIASVLGVLVAVGALSIARAWRPRSLLTMRPALSAGAGGLAVSALSLVALTGVSGHGHAIGEGDGHAGHTNDIQAAAATAPLTPAAAIAQCRRTAEVRTDAAFAKAATAANGKAAAIIKAEKAAKKMLKRELAKCATAPAPTKQVIEATPHPADGHGH